jgi:hypothetical protein
MLLEQVYIGPGFNRFIRCEPLASIVIYNIGVTHPNRTFTK